MEFWEGNPGNRSLEAHCLNGQIFACLTWAGTRYWRFIGCQIKIPSGVKILKGRGLKPERFFFFFSPRGEGARGL